MVGKIRKVPLRDVWKHEALDLTRWMEDNIDVVNETLDLDLTVVEREKSVGSFNVDLMAEDINGDTVIIENQLEKSNHDHLGKVLTYLTSLEAKTAIWIVKDARPEHIKAISWLNESSAARFYLIKIEAIQIGDSDPAPLLTMIVSPSEEAIQIGKIKKGLAEREILRREWWTCLLDYSRTKTKLHSDISPNIYSWIGTGSGKSGIGFNYSVRKDAANIELYIDMGKEKDDENTAAFNKFLKSKDKVESIIGEELEWMPLEGKRACRIQKQIPGGYLNDKEEWLSIHEKMVEIMTKFDKAFRPLIKKLK